ncbi:MAG: tetratricopeptide repeat protein, partial [Maribacter sp.]
MPIKFPSLIFLILIGWGTLFCQERKIKSPQNRLFIDGLIQAKSYQEAKQELDLQLDYYFEHQVDSLPGYVRLVGNYELAGQNWESAANKAEQFVAKVKKVSKPTTYIQALIELSNLYFDARFHQKNYDVSKEALHITKSLNSPDPSKISFLEYNMGNALLYMGKNVEARILFKRVKNILDQNPDIEPEQFYNTYNNLGRVFANISQVDSSNYYYEKALDVLERFKNSTPDVFYRKAIIENNLSLNHQNTGKTEKAIATLQRAAENFKKYFETGDDESKKIRAKRNRLIAIDNLGTFFSGKGEYTKALELIELSYRQKLGYLPKDDPDITISKILLAEAHFAAKNYSLADDFMNQVLLQIEKNPKRLAYIDSYSKNLKA